jgi:indole-3-glycerol phosphate synthase
VKRVLTSILESKRREIATLTRGARSSRMEPRPVALERRAGDPLRLIAEIKRRSPSAGELSTRLSVAERATAYEAAGASMISVLCDGPFFDGSFEHLTQARAACSLPLLCKEFILDSVQLDAAIEHGADAVLLIVRCLDDAQLTHLVAESRKRGLQPLVEVHGADECRSALEAGADWIGVNARDLDTLELDVAGARDVVEQLPAGVTAIHLSGVKSTGDIEQVARTRADAVLLGEALMRLDDPTELLTELVSAAR